MIQRFRSAEQAPGYASHIITSALLVAIQTLELAGTMRDTDTFRLKKQHQRDDASHLLMLRLQNI
jgi:hypothetical protein